jgi:pyruvate,water dikinase
MTLTQVWGSLLIFVLCPILGGLPLIEWITYGLTRRRLSRLGTKNISVSAAFYHGGKVPGILAVLSEALKGIAAVLLARSFFPVDAAWELIALVALVFGRYWIGKGAGTTNVTWGYIVHDPIAALLVFLLGGIGFTVMRERELGRTSVLILFPLITALRHSDSNRTVAAIVLASLLWWIYKQIPDDLDLKAESAQAESQTMFKFFRGDGAARSLSQPLEATKVGQKAATLARLKLLGYPVPMGWVLMPGDDPAPLVEFLRPSREQPLVVRSSAIGEDSDTASAAGQYETILNVIHRDQLFPAIAACFESYEQPSAVQYRRDRGVAEASMVVLIQEQVKGVFSGVAFSRDPILRQGEAVLIEALPGSADRVVSGKLTPESYRVAVPEIDGQTEWTLPAELNLAIEGSGEVPAQLIQQVAYLARHLERQFNGIPQDIEWTFDGQTLWILQSRSITTLLPIWTRKIAAEVIPGTIRPLTWSINRPLTCGVWGDLFTVVLGDRARGLDFTETATLHYSNAYFNASLLGQLFLRMGLPPESLEFLTRGAKFSKPPIGSTLRNVSGLLKLAGRELRLEREFQQDNRSLFEPAIAEFTVHPVTELSESAIFDRIELVLTLLKRATYYSILAPLSAALTKAITKVSDEAIDNSRAPEVAALRSLQQSARPDLTFETWIESTEGQQFFQRYGYLSEVGTDIAVPTWREDAEPVRSLFNQFCQSPPPAIAPHRSKSRAQRRMDLKGQVTEGYSRLLAELRWSFVELEKRWLAAGILSQPGDIFFLKYEELRGAQDFGQKVAQRRSQFEQDQQIAQVPYLVYGDDPPEPSLQTWQASNQLQGIGASPGQKEGRIKVMKSLSSVGDVDRDTILVVPYTDSGWAPLLAQVGGLISEVGGRLSHGAIVAREYRIPAVMDTPNATQRLQDGQHVRIDGTTGNIEIL